MIVEMLSDQLLDWSDIAKTRRLLIAKKTSTTRRSTHPTGKRSSRLTHRTLQTLRKTRMPLCTGPGPRSKVLPIDQSIGSSTADALCSSELSRTGRGLPASVSEDSTDPERNYEHQPRAFEASRTILKRLHGRSGSGFRHGHDRVERSGPIACQYARCVVAGADGSNSYTGGVS